MFPVPICLTRTAVEIFWLFFAIDWFYLMSALAAGFCRDGTLVAVMVKTPVMDGSAPGTCPGLAAMQIDQEGCMKGSRCTRLEQGERRVQEVDTSHL